MRLIYPGPYDRVTVPAAGAVADVGVPVDIPDHLAASLVEQGWIVADDDAPDDTIPADDPATITADDPEED